MGYANDASSAAFSDADVFILRDRMLDLTARLSDRQVTLLTDALLSVLRERRSDRVYHSIDVRL